MKASCICKWISLGTLVVALLLGTAIWAGAQTSIEATNDFGRVYSVVDGKFLPTLTSGLVVENRGFTLSFALALAHGRTLFEHDLLGGWEHTQGRLTFGANGGVYVYRGMTRDWSLGGGMRWKIR